MQKFSYHMHTTFSDGKNSIKEMVAQAESLGFDEIGISDHLIVPYNGFSAIYDAVRQHLQDICEAAASSSIKVYTGFKVDHNSHPGWLEQFQTFKKKQDIGYIISGNHRTYDTNYENFLSIFFQEAFGVAHTSFEFKPKDYFQSATSTLFAGC